MNINNNDDNSTKKKSNVQLRLLFRQTYAESILMEINQKRRKGSKRNNKTKQNKINQKKIQKMKLNVKKRIDF